MSRKKTSTELVLFTFLVLIFAVACGKKSESASPVPGQTQNGGQEGTGGGGSKPTPSPTPEPVSKPKPDNKPGTRPTPPPSVNAPDLPTPPVENKPGGPDRFHAATVWSHVQGSERWSEILHAHVRAHMGEFERARDVESFCPGYKLANREHREICWLRLVSSIVKYECGFNPRKTLREKNGSLSVGMLSLTVGECVNAPTVESLKDPAKNLSCGVGMMARMIARAGFIEGPASARGAAAYWSVLRPPYSSDQYDNLGKRPLIIAQTKRYKQY